MYVNVKNENYGFAVATYGDYVAVGNPTFFRYDIVSPTVYRTGSMDLYRYNKNADQHELFLTCGKLPTAMPILLSRETGSGDIMTQSLHTELNNSGVSFDKDLAIDKESYFSMLDDGFGYSIDMYNKYVVVGSPWWSEIVHTDAIDFRASGSAVDIFDIGLVETVPFTGSSIGVYSIENPDEDQTGSFGMSVSINNEWLAIGSPYYNNSSGRVYMYRNNTVENNYSWSFYQAIDGQLTNAEFGGDIKINKVSGSLSHSMVIGNKQSWTNEAYYYEFSGSSWNRVHTFTPTTDIHNLPFGNYPPYQTTMSVSSSFGTAVSIYDETVVIGAPTDRKVYEYSGSAQYEEGATYVFERCTGTPDSWELVLKTYGNENTLKSNRMGYSVDIFGDNIVAGIPKVNHEILTSCYIQGTLNQLHQCNTDLITSLSGQSLFLQRNLTSSAWEITNVYQRKKKYLSPYRNYGDDVSIADRSMVVGAPMQLSGSNRYINISTTQSQAVILDDIMGKSYIYNLKNLREKFHVGNVFYRNGKIVIMTSGSIFDGLFYNPTSTNAYEYDLKFKGQHTIFEKQVICNVTPGEFNVSTNPTAVYFATSSLDINGNGIFDFQDMDVLMRYMQYKNTSFLNLPVSTDWSSSVVVNDDEKSLLQFYQNQQGYDNVQTAELLNEHIEDWEYVHTDIQRWLDFNQDNRIDLRDMNIMWKFFTNRLTQVNYTSYITPSCNRTLFSDIIDYMDQLTQKTSKPQIKSMFLDYERLTATDKTGSFVAPYVTTIGLYSGLELVMLAKLGSPIKITPELPINFVVKMDY